MATAFGLNYRIDRLRQRGGGALMLGALGLGLVLSIAVATIAGLLPQESEPILMAPLRWSS
jgi:hypothetical protein